MWCIYNVMNALDMNTENRQQSVSIYDKPRKEQVPLWIDYNDHMLRNCRKKDVVRYH